MQITRCRTASPSSSRGLVYCLVLSVALGGAVVLCVGCRDARLSHYEPQGPSVRLDSLRSLEDKLPTHFVYYPTTDLTAEDMERGLRDVVDDHIRLRPSNPSFRSLCALLNTYYGEWNRLIILERVGFADDSYGFVVIAETPHGSRAVTNLVYDEHLTWKAATSLRQIQLAAQPFEDIKTELDKARGILPQRLLWYDNIDWPLYVLHDVKADGSNFSFAVCGWGNRAGSIEHIEKPLVDYATASKLIRQAGPWEGVDSASPRGQQLFLAGKPYAVLLSQIWRVALGQADDKILGKAPRK